MMLKCANIPRNSSFTSKYCVTSLKYNEIVEDKLDGKK